MRPAVGMTNIMSYLGTSEARGRPGPLNIRQCIKRAKTEISNVLYQNH